MSDRRNFLIGLTALVGFPLAHAARPSRSVQILVVRESREPRACGEQKYTPGTLYGVPNGLALEDAVPPLGLKRIARVEELGYQENAPNVSAIPVGTYDGFVRDDPTKSWMTNANRRWRIELKNVPGGRTAIQFHYGKDYSWSRGCIILTGDQEEGLVCRPAENTSEAVVERLRDFVQSTGISSPQLIRVRIMYAG